MSHLATAQRLTDSASNPSIDADFRLGGLSRAEAYIARTRFDRPTLVFDLDVAIERYRALSQGLGPRTAIHYAVKANPAAPLLARLSAAGCRFDAASRAEIEICLAAGASPEHISFGNTIKRPADIAFAFGAGVRLFAVDAEEEVHKLAELAPGAEVFVRLLVDNPLADWPLSRKFGCAPAKALQILDLAASLGLRPVGLSFHVGSQTRDPRGWNGPLDTALEVWRAAHAAGHRLDLLNIGGGFPASYDKACPDPEDYARAVSCAVALRFGPVPRIIAEPGRGLSGEAGAIAASVVLVGRKNDDDVCRWVFLDIGKFSGLAETMEEAIRYEILTSRDGGATGPCILAGPSCDSADVLYEKRPMQLPLDLRCGDRVIIRNAGVYTSTYSTVGFNGFPPLDIVCI